MPSIRPRFLASLLILASTFVVADAQTPAPNPAPAPPPVPTSYTTPDAVRERLQKLLPKAYEKLRKRQPLHIVAVTDELITMPGHGEDAGNQKLSWPVQLAQQLGNEFAYSSGVRVLAPGRARGDNAGQPEITMRLVRVEGSVIRKALAAATAHGASPPADIVIVGAGRGDVERGGDLMSLAEPLHVLIESLAASGADLMLCGPVLDCSDAAAGTLSNGRALAGVMRDAALEAGVAFGDLGDLAGLVRFTDDALLAEHSFDYVVQQLRLQHAWPGDVSDLVHPLPSYHRRLAVRAYEQIAGTSAVAPWSVGNNASVVLNDNKAAISCEIANTTKALLSILVQPMPMQAWQPTDKPAVIRLKAGEKHAFTFTYARANVARSFTFPPLAAHEPLLRVPLFVATSSEARIEEVRAAIMPVAILWKLDTTYNQSHSFNLDNMLLNTSGKELKDLSWSAEWAGQKKQGKVDLAAGKGSTLPLTFDLPKDTGARRVASPVMFTVEGAGVRMQAMRAIEVSQNIGLDQEVPLASNGSSKATAVLRVEADAQSARVIFDLADLALQNDASGKALKAELHFDARSYGKRLEQGCTEAIVVQAGAADGDGVVSPIPPWAFGTGYAMRFNEQGVGAKLSTDASKHRLLTITLPRSYLYLHEWAIGNGNSQIGLAVKLSTTDGKQVFELAQNNRDRDDAQSHIVLELTPKPTSRWSVIAW